jgi:hypothetical protein
MSQPELLKHVVHALAAASIDYMVTGSVASSLQGEPRASHDIDLVIAMSPAAVTQFVSLFPPEFYVSEAAIRDALRHRCYAVVAAIAGRSETGQGCAT